MAYAKRLTKERLIQEGFTNITKDGRLFKGEHEVFPHWNGKENNPNRYLCIIVNQRDSEGHLVKGNDRVYKYTRKDGTIAEYKGRIAKNETFGLHRVMWAWYYGEVPEGMVVDHINNQHLSIEDYHLDNLQLLTPRENLAKERTNWSIRELPCKLDRPRSYYEDKLEKYEALYEAAKQNKDKELCHKLRGNLSQTRARLRYWDNHRDEYVEKDTAQLSAKKQSVKERKILAQYRQMFRENGNKAMWHQVCAVIKSWNSLDSEQKEHIFEVLNKHFSLSE